MKGSEIKNLDFRVGFLGFKKSDVKACLAEISEYTTKLEDKVYNLQIEKDKIKDQLHKIEISQANFKDIITSAQEFKKRIEQEAEERAGELIKKAKKQYEEILKGIKNEKAKFSLIRREIENLKNNIITKLENFEGMVEIKEKNISFNENISFNNNVENKDVKDEVFKAEKINNIASEKDSDADSYGKTLEFNTKPIQNNKSIKNNDENYIKSKFQEIELK